MKPYRTCVYILLSCSDLGLWTGTHVNPISTHVNPISAKIHQTCVYVVQSGSDLGFWTRTHANSHSHEIYLNVFQALLVRQCPNLESHERKVRCLKKRYRTCDLHRDRGGQASSYLSGKRVISKACWQCDLHLPATATRRAL